jgi:lambda repressor-like predicted transcriptional regulator
MPTTPTYRPDRERILALIRERGETVSSFALALGRHPRTFWKLKDQPISKSFATQIATALGVPVSEITRDEVAA